MDDITRHWSAGDEEYQPIKYAYIDDHGNRVVVGCTEYYNDEYLSFLRENLPRFYVIAFVACDDFGEEAISLETTINGYTELCSYTSSTIPDDVEQFPCFSYGCKAKKVVNGTTKYGFITAGHAVNVGEYVFPTPPSLYSPIGTCTNSIYQPNLGVDAAFVERSDASYTLSTGIPSQPTYTLSTTYSYAMQGDPILKCGKETLETPGTVVIASFSILIVGTYYYMDMALTNYHSLQGDSGGLVYSLDEATGIATPMGIHSTAIAPVQLQTWNITPSYSPNWDGNYKLYCKMYYALSYLGVSLSS